MIGEWLGGLIRVELVCAAPLELLKRLADTGITQWEIEAISPFCLRFWLKRRDLAAASSLCRKSGGKLKVISIQGLPVLLSRLFRHKALVLCCLMLLWVTWFLPSRILFLEVSGNQRIGTEAILSAARESGLVFGTARRKIRSEFLKNQLISRIPELKWVGINTRGCRAMILVREGQQGEFSREISPESDIVAYTDGIISEIRLRTGNALCTTGQAVTAGQVLISGSLDVGICTVTTGADGDILASTQKELTVISPSERLLRLSKTGQTHTLSLILGKKRIKLWSGSRNLPSTCGRIRKQTALTLPGGYPLPVWLETETCWQGTIISEESPQDFLPDEARTYLLSQTIAGVIRQEITDITRQDDVMILTGQYQCEEMIGRVQHGLDRGIPWEK